MAAHNTERYIGLALDSIERVCSASGREFLVFVADDASTDGTYAIASGFASKSSASVFSCQTFPKASSVSEAKNRSVAMACRHLLPSDWVLFLDDDDEMLLGRIRLVEAAEASGFDAVVGNYCHASGQGEPFAVDNSRLVSSFGFSPGTTAVRGSLVPANGMYFDEVPAGCLDDYCTHAAMSARGVKWRHIDTPPVLLYRLRDGSLTSGRSRQMLEDSMRHMLWGAGASVNVRPRIAPARVAAKPSVGMVCCSLNVGGVERWLSMLVSATRNDFNWVGVGVETSIGGIARQMIHEVPTFDGVDQCVSLAKKCDILIMWGVSFAHRYKYESRAKLVLTNHGGPSKWNMAAIRSVPIEIVTAVHSCSDYAATVLPPEAKKKSRVIYNVVSEDSIRPSKPGESVILEHGLPHKSQIASMICRISPEKRWLLGLAGISMVPGVHGVICGSAASDVVDGRIQSFLDALSPSLTYAGWQRSVGDILQVSDVLVAPSNREEGCQYTLMEAALAGVPIVSTPFGVAHDHPEIVSAMLPEEPAIDDVAKACISVLQGGQRVRDTVDRARDLMESKYNPSWWRKQWVSFFREL